jgi:phage/conjugal plasmid C-4 type zinc finger TraR family protein
MSISSFAAASLPFLRQGIAVLVFTAQVLSCRVSAFGQWRIAMATGWAKEGAVQEQIDATVAEAIERARSQLPQGPGLERCEECDALIPKARREAVPGVRLCVTCQEAHDQEQGHAVGYNRRGSKDSQLR